MRKTIYRRPVLSSRLLFLLSLSFTSRYMSSITTAEDLLGYQTNKRATAIFASRSRVDDLVTWLTDHRDALRGTNVLAGDLLAQRLSWDNRLSDLKIRPISSEAEAAVDDIRIAGQTLAGEISSIVYFPDNAPGAGEVDLNLLVRATNAAKVPLALNEATADLMFASMRQSRSGYLIFNPIAGHGDVMAELELIRSILEPQMELTVVHTEDGQDVGEVAKGIVEKIQASPGFSANEIGSSMMIIVAGGDGTVSAVAGATMGTGIPFGVIPRGTGNAFSQALGIPGNLEAACVTILKGYARVVDGALCNDKPMILVGGVGYEAGMVENASRERKDRIGPLAYFLGGIEQAFIQEPFKCKVTIDGEEEEIVTSGVTVANVAPPTCLSAQGFGEVTPNDGLLDVTISTANGWLSSFSALGSLWASSVVKTPSTHGALVCNRGKIVTIDCEPPQKIVIDGEILEANPITFKSVPKGLRVFIPEPIPEDEVDSADYLFHE